MKTTINCLGAIINYLYLEHDTDLCLSNYDVTYHDIYFKERFLK